MRFLRARFIVSHGLEVRRRFRLSAADSLPCLISRSGRSFSDRSARARRRGRSQRAVRSCDEASVRLSPTASPCSRRLRLPICLRAQLTAFLTKLRGSSAAFPISPSSGRNLSSGDRLVSDRQRRRQREGRAPDVFLLARSVSLDQLVGERGATQQVLTAQVADVPCVELLRPAVDEFDGRLPGIGDHRGQQAGLVPARVPKRDGQRVVRTRLPGDLSQRGNRNAQRPFRRNAETAQPLRCSGEAAARRMAIRSSARFIVVVSVRVAAGSAAFTSSGRGRDSRKRRDPFGRLRRLREKRERAGNAAAYSRLVRLHYLCRQM